MKKFSGTIRSVFPYALAALMVPALIPSAHAESALWKAMYEGAVIRHAV